MVRYFIDASATTDGFFPCFTAKEYFNMNHVMFLNVLGLIVDCTIEDKVARLHFFFLNFDWASIKLVGLVAWA